MAIEIRRITAPDEKLLITLTDWLYNWWGILGGYKREQIYWNLYRSMQDIYLPATFVMFDGDIPVGMYQFVREDLFVRPDLCPWLANLYITGEYRGRGLGRRLIESVKDNAARCLPGEECLYLFTTHEGLYERYGWSFVEQVDTFFDHDPIQRLYQLALKP